MMKIQQIVSFVNLKKSVMPYKGICVDCGDEKWIINSKGRCAKCQKLKNNGEGSNKLFRTHQKKRVNKIYNSTQKRLKNDKKDALINKDEELYEYIFETKTNVCEECGASLPGKFRDIEGNVIARWQYSHILSKGAYPQLRHNKENINRLCFECHQKWEFGKREEMNIYEKNLKVIEHLLKNLKR